MKKAAALVLAAMMGLFCLAGCSQPDPQDLSGSPYLGTWEATTAIGDGVEMDVRPIFGEMSFTLKDDGSCTYRVIGQEISGFWTESETGFIVDEDYSFVVDGDAAVLPQGEITFHLEKR